MANLLLIVGLFVVTLIAGSSFLGVGFMTTSALILALGVVLLASAAKFVALPIKVSPGILAVAGILMVTFSTGVLSSILSGGLPTGQVTGGQPLPAAITSTSATTSVSGTLQETCRANGQSAGILGKASTVTVNAWDREANAAYSAPVTVIARYYVNGVYKSTVDTSGKTLTAAVGDVVSIFGAANSTYYLDKGEFCVENEASSASLDAHAIVGINAINLTLYDDTASTELSAGTISDEEDYDIALSADQEKKIFIRAQVNGADTSFQFAAIATSTQNDISSVEVKESGFTSSYVPKFLKNIQISNGTKSGSAATNFTKWDTVWKPSTPILMHEFEEKKFPVTIKAGSTDPTTNAAWGSSDVAMFCFLDAAYARGTDGKEYNDYFVHDNAESNVGLVEDVKFPVGKDACAVLEGL